jgi:hydroxyacyl-ACP dehydratase HTD2-like protein with hotdog domain
MVYFDSATTGEIKNAKNPVSQNNWRNVKPLFVNQTFNASNTLRSRIILGLFRWHLLISWWQPMRVVRLVRLAILPR